MWQVRIAIWNWQQFSVSVSVWVRISRSFGFSSRPQIGQYLLMTLTWIRHANFLLFFFGFYSPCKFGSKVVKLVWHNVVVSVYLSASFDFENNKKKKGVGWVLWGTGRLGLKKILVKYWKWADLLSNIFCILINEIVKKLFRNFFYS